MPRARVALWIAIIVVVVAIIGAVLHAMYLGTP
jgi:hypothetical protein